MNTLNVTFTWLREFSANAENGTVCSAEQVREILRERGWSWRRAAKFLGYSESHFFKVVAGIHKSNTLLAKISRIPQSPVPFHPTGFARKSTQKGTL